VILGRNDAGCSVSEAKEKLRWASLLPLLLPLLSPLLSQLSPLLPLLSPLLQRHK